MRGKFRGGRAAQTIARLLLAATVTATSLLLPLQAQEASGVSGYYRAPSDGGARWLQAKPGSQITLYSATSLSADIRASPATGTTFANLGCVSVDEVLWCKLRAMHPRSEGHAPGVLLAPVVGPDGTIAVGLDDSRTRATRKRFDATAQAPCAQERGQALTICQIGVARSGGGDATVSATFPNGFSRLLFFVHGDFTRGNSTMSGVGTDMNWQVKDGIHMIRVDDQRFEIPVDFVLGQ